MTHYMNLRPQPFRLIATGQKTIELRLYDEKRQAIRLGDRIVFSHSEHPERQLCAVVRNLYVYPSFEALYRSLPLEKCGYLPNELAAASPRDMEQYYSPEKQRQYGVLGIEIQLTGL